MIRRPPRSTLSSSSAASDVYKRQALVALRYQRWLLLIALLIALAWRIRPFFAQFGLLDRALWGLRPSFRSHAPQPVRLEISEEGLRESDSGVESFAPWTSVRSYRLGKQFVEIELSNNLYAYVPSQRLSPASSSWADLVTMLEQRGIPRSGLTPSSTCLLYTSPSPRDRQKSRMPSSA